jgi:cytoskeletal protein RodZ
MNTKKKRGTTMNTTQLPAPEIQPPTPPPKKKRHRIRKALLLIGSALVGLIVLIVIVSVAGSHSATPNAAPAAKAPSSAPAKPSAAPSTAPPSSSVSQFGASNGFTYTDGTKVYVTSATPTTLSQEAAGGNPGDPAVNVAVEVTAGKTALDASQIQVAATGGPNGTQLSQAFDSTTNDPSGTLAPGETGTYTFEFDLVQASNGSNLNVTVTPGFSYNAASFTGAVSGS